MDRKSFLGWRMGTGKSVTVTVSGDPVGKGRPRFSTSGGYARAYTPKKTAMFENLVRLEYESQCGYRYEDDCMLDLRVIAYFPIPKSASKKRKALMQEGIIRPTVKPDADNLVKSIADSLNGIAYRDDKQIVDCQVRKFYSETPRTVISIRSIK